MKGLLSLIRRTTPSSFAYICEKNGDSLSDKVNYWERYIWYQINNFFFPEQYKGKGKGEYQINNLLSDALCFFFFLCLIYLQMDELACFAPGMLALGSSGYGPDDSQKFLSLAEEVY